MRILFFYPPRWKQFYRVISEGFCIQMMEGPSFTDTQVACATVVKESTQAEVKILDAAFEEMKWKDVREHIIREKYDYVFTMIPWIYWKSMSKTIEFCNEAGSKAVVYAQLGPSAREMATLSPEPYCLILTEPEKVMRDLARGLKREEIKSVCYRENGKLVEAPQYKSIYPAIQPLDLSLVPQNYFQKYDTHYYQTTRGCPYRCFFCMWGSCDTDTRYAIKPVDTVIQDVKNLYQRNPVKIFILCAQMGLGAEEEWTEAFCKGVQKHCRDLRFNTNISPLSRKDLVLKLHRSGMGYCSIGVESLSDSALQKLGKCHTVKDTLSMIYFLGMNRIPFSLNLRTDFGETDDEINETYQVIKTLCDHGIRAEFTSSPIYYWSGTKLRKEISEDSLTLATNFKMPVHVRSDIGSHYPAWKRVFDLMRGHGWVEVC